MRPQREVFGLPAAFVALALLLGGAGIHYPLVELALELLAIAAAAMLVRDGNLSGVGRAVWVALAIFVAALGLMALQLVPLPPALWHALPGRSIAAGIYALLGWADRWHALSLAPDQTFRDMLAVLPALAAFLVMAGTASAGRILLLRVLIGLAVLGTAFAAAQVAAGDQAFVVFETAHRGSGVGFFVNRNHQATFLLVAIVIAAMPGVVTVRGGKRSIDRRVVVFALIAFLALGVLATTSRTALALLPISLLVATLLTVEPRRVLRWLLASALLYALIGLALSRTAMVEQTLSRFSSPDEYLRYLYWENTRYAIEQSMPWGTGFGSFEAIYRSVEPLAQVTQFYVNHAHSDYLELVLEGGIPAVLLMVAAAVGVAALIRWAWRRASGHRASRAVVIVAVTGLFQILAFSVVDFPLRMTAIGVIFGLLLGLLVDTPARSASRRDRRARRLRGRPAVALGVGAAIAALCVLSAGLGTALARGGSPEAATLVAPWSADAWSARANQEQAARHADLAADAGLRALAIAPLDAAAVRAVAYAWQGGPHAAAGDNLFQLAAALGWRDPLTQAWIAQRALASGNLGVGLERVDALLRLGVGYQQLEQQLRAVFALPGGGEAIAQRIAEHAPWRQGFLNAIAADAPDHVPDILALLARLRALGVPATASDTALIRWSLSDAGNFAGARSIWVASGGHGLLADGDFASLSGVLPSSAGPYTWTAPAGSGIHVSVSEPEGGAGARAVVIGSDGYVAASVLAQLVALAPGPYRFAVMMRSGAGGIPADWSLVCRGQAGAPPIAVPLAWQADTDGWQRGIGRFEIAANCPGQTLTLSTRESGGQPLSLQIRRVEIVAETR